jgi:predicted nucleic acid-binding protein
VKVFLDTKVLASAFGTRGLCADVLRLILAEHQLVTGEVVIEELRSVLRRKFGVPARTVKEVEAFLRGYLIEPQPRNLPDLPLRGRNDLLVARLALGVRAEVLVTGDREMLDLKTKLKDLRIFGPREFWNLTAGK